MTEKPPERPGEPQLGQEIPVFVFIARRGGFMSPINDPAAGIPQTDTSAAKLLIKQLSSSLTLGVLRQLLGVVEREVRDVSNIGGQAIEALERENRALRHALAASSRFQALQNATPYFTFGTVVAVPLDGTGSNYVIVSNADTEEEQVVNADELHPKVGDGVVVLTIQDQHAIKTVFERGLPGETAEIERVVDDHHIVVDPDGMGSRVIPVVQALVGKLADVERVVLDITGSVALMIDPDE